MLLNDKVTIYHYDSVTKAYTRIPSLNAFVDYTQRSSFSRTGVANAESVFIMIPYTGSELELAQGKDLIVIGDCTYDIDNTTTQAQSMSIKTLRDTYKSMILVMIDYKLYGSKNMWHYELSCK